jgi:hypothetical protein
MAFGELNLNYDAATGGLYYKDSVGAVVKVGPCQVSATAPNSTPAGSAGNSAGEFWYDTANNVLKVYNGTAWVESGGSVDSVSGTAPITVNNTDPLNPVIGINAASTTQAGAVQLNDTTSSTSTTEAATANAVKSAYDLANSALPKAGGTMTGDITFNAGQVFPGVVTDVTAVGGSAISVDNTDPTQPVLSIAAASTSVVGVVQLNDTTSSTSTTEALTANQGKKLQDEIDALVISSNLTLAGTLDASTGDLVTVTNAGTAAGFAIGDPLPAAAAGNSEFFVIATVGAASYTPPGGTATEVHVGDWFLSDGTVWNFLDVGFAAPYASTTSPGVVQLATDAEVQAGSNTDHVVTPSGLQSKVSDSTSTSSSTTLASSTAVKSAYDLANAAIPDSTFNAKGDIIVGTGDDTYGNFPVGTNGQVLVVDSTETFGVKWADPAPSGVVGVTGTAPITVDNTDPANPIIGINAASTTQAGAVQLNDTVTSTSTTEAATANAAKTAYDAAVAAQSTADAALPKAGGTMTGNITFDPSESYPNLGVVFKDTSKIEGISDSTSSTSSIIAASSTAVKAAYDAAIAAQTNGPLTSDTTLYVNCTDGNNSTAARGTDKPFATIAAALSAASDGDTIFLSAGTFTENFTISKGVHLAGVFSDQATWSGTKILGNVIVNLAGGVTRNLAVSDIYFISANSTSPMSITGMSPGAGGINTFTGCMFTQANVSDTAQFALQTSGTWTRSLYLRGCTIDGNFKHNAGTTAGASGYIVVDELLGIGNSNMYHSILTGTVEYRDPSNSLASILQTGGIVLVNNASSGITANGATTTAIFGGTGFSYKGTAASAGTGTIYFQGGSNQGTGKVSVGANMVYGWTNLTMDPANLTVSGSAIAYTTAVPAAANAQSLTQQRPRLDLLKNTSSIAAANQLATVIDSATGAIYSVDAMDAGTY